MHGTATPATRKKRGRRTFWLKQLHTWHWMSSAISLIGLLLFAITGFTLNHAAEIEASPEIVEHSARLPAELLPQLAPARVPDGARQPLPADVATWLETELPLSIHGNAEWSADEAYLALPRPGGDGWVAIDRTTGEITAERTSRGWIAYLNDLHKGRNAGTVWRWFIDVFVFACVIFSLTGLVLLQLHAKNRRSTWPLVAAGLAIPAAIAIFFIH
ncbi:PepSY-associated TM helix domain-containing protein [Sphingosinithalassobacter sp. CS137]|uniref:PepSY-associated TM helix domain-containing protein n=1 Tax=Sphingosinithalassobacter sp. CS137 TaxID=2762748 RepID=UPI00165D2FE8|nr:PepSY-associated TM helix domain-containing protein [Sphingosinithalassobacter sp. CS137]